jgi:hypothetical protein
MVAPSPLPSPPVGEKGSILGAIYSTTLPYAAKSSPVR